MGLYKLVKRRVADGAFVIPVTRCSRQLLFVTHSLSLIVIYLNDHDNYIMASNNSIQSEYHNGTRSVSGLICYSAVLRSNRLRCVLLFLYDGKILFLPT